MDRWDIENITDMITWLGFFTSVFLSYYHYLRFRNKERLVLIEKNVDLSEIYKKSERQIPWYLIGFTLMGAGLGFVIAFSTLLFIRNIYPRILDQGTVFMILISATFLFGALGIITGHTIERKKKAARG